MDISLRFLLKQEMIHYMLDVSNESIKSLNVMNSQNQELFPVLLKYYKLINNIYLVLNDKEVTHVIDNDFRLFSDRATKTWSMNKVDVINNNVLGFYKYILNYMDYLYDYELQNYEEGSIQYRAVNSVLDILREFYEDTFDDVLLINKDKFCNGLYF